MIAGAIRMIRMMRISTTMLATASGFFMSFLMPSRKNVVLLDMTSCCFFSSSVAGSNCDRSSCALRIFFLGSLLASYSAMFIPPQSYWIRGSTAL
jgi:hypothetical protein